MQQNVWQVRRVSPHQRDEAAEPAQANEGAPALSKRESMMQSRQRDACKKRADVGQRRVLQRRNPITPAVAVRRVAQMVGVAQKVEQERCQTSQP